jgi:uncharacterized protein YyaL (SSP411 family)
MDRTTYADPRVVSIVTSRFVPIRVDPDRRPDISHRYALGGWPTTALLTPDGRMLAGGTFVDAERLAAVLARVDDAFISGRHRGMRASSQDHAARAPGPPASVDQLVHQVMQAFDPEHGGFGGAPKFPHVSPVRLALDLYQETGTAAFHHAAVTTLDAMGWGPLYDEEFGGFFRYSQDVDWTHPSHEKLLDVNASLLSLYLEAMEALHLTRYGDRARDVLQYVQTWLVDPVDGGWAGSQCAGPEYSAEPGGETVAVTPPAVDRTQYTDWNAVMVSAALHAGRVLADESLSQFAITSLERVVLQSYKPGAGVAHYFDGAAHVRGLLDDQMTMAAAHLDAFDLTGNVVYAMMAEELALYAIRTMWDGEGDGFFDRVIDPRRDVGLLTQPLKPFAANCAAARMLRRLSRASGSGEFADYAERTLGAVAAQAASEGALAAEYVLAVRPPRQ